MTRFHDKVLAWVAVLLLVCLGGMAAGEGAPASAAPVDGNGPKIAIKAHPLQAIVQRDGQPHQVVRLAIESSYPEPTEAVVELTGVKPTTVQLRAPGQTVELAAPAVPAETAVKVTVRIAGQDVAQCKLTRRPVRPWEF